MAYIEIRVSGTPRAARKRGRVRKTFRDTREGIAAKNDFVSDLEDIKTAHSVRQMVNGRLTNETFPTKRNAEARKRELETEAASGSVVDPRGGRITVDELAERWLASNPGKRGSTKVRDRSAFNQHVSPAIGRHEVRTVRQPAIQALVNEWSAIRKPETVARTYSALRAAFEYAVTAGLLPANPCHHIALPQIRRQQRRLPAPQELAALSAVMDQRDAAMMWTGALLGLRWGEVAALRIRDLDLLSGRLTVSANITRDEHGRSVIGAPKTDAGRRTLAIPPSLVEVLATHLGSAGLTGADSDELVFSAKGGGPLSYTNFRARIWNPAVAEVGLDGLGFHDLRRLAATTLVSSGVDVRTAQTRLGHTSPQVTLALYAQATTEADQAAANAVENQFASAMQGRRSVRLLPQP